MNKKLKKYLVSYCNINFHFVAAMFISESPAVAAVAAAKAAAAAKTAAAAAVAMVAVAQKDADHAGFLAFYNPENCLAIWRSYGKIMAASRAAASPVAPSPVAPSPAVTSSEAEDQANHFTPDVEHHEANAEVEADVDELASAMAKQSIQAKQG